MTDIIPTTIRAKRRLLLGAAASTLACALSATPARAQSTDIRTTAAKLLVNSQANQGSIILTDSANAQLTTTIAGPIDASTVMLSDNAVTTAARGNRTRQDLAAGELDTTSAFGPTALTVGAGGVMGNAGMLLANHQSNKASEIIANSKDSVLGIDSAIAINSGHVTGSKLSIADNTQEALALGNDAAATLTTIGGADTGAGIVSSQTADRLSGVAARSFGSAGITAQDVSASNITVSGNLERGIAYGNAVDDALTAKPTAVEAPETGDIASTVPAIGSGDPTTSAAYAILSSQSDGGVVKARAGGGTSFASGLVATGNVDASSLANDDNALVAAGYGNQSSNNLDIDTMSIARAGAVATGAIADVTGVQSLGDTSRIIATTLPSTITHVFGNATASRLSVLNNNAQTIATGNLASGNRLTVKAGTIDVSQDNLPSSRTAGSALTTPAGGASSSAAFSVQNVQDYGKASISAASVGNAAALEVGGTVSGSTLHDDGNSSTVAATGNSASNAASLDATTMTTSADVNNLQTGDGNVTVSLGSPDHRAGATLSALGPVADSTISLAGNQAIGIATANTSTNTLTVTANTLRDGSGRSNAQAGPVGDGYGAAATFALANEQKTGEPSIDGSTTPTIASNVIGRFAINGDGFAERSSLAVEANLQHAGALANDSVNRLSIAATANGGGDASPHGAALSSSQYGQANITAASDVKFVALGATDHSTVSVSRDTNDAVATMNQADNGLFVDGAQIGSLTGGDADIATSPLGPPTASGDHVLANQQFATGAANAFAATRFLNGDVAGGVEASRITIADNVTSADAAANRSLNAVSVTSAVGTAGNAGLVNTQINTGIVTASAITAAAFSVTGTPLASADRDSAVAIDGNQTAALARGNVADNQLTLNGSGELIDPVAAATLQPFGAPLHAAGALLNSQASYGAVTATASNTGYSVPLNAAGAVNGSTLDVDGNSALATAYGNVASNRVAVSSLGRLPIAAIANAQINYGPVTAQVTGASYRITSSPLSASAFGITSNQLAATAVGNQASSAIAATR